MKSGVLIFGIVSVVILFAPTVYADSESVVEVEGVPGTTIKFVYTKNDNPVAHIVAFPGGKGYIGVNDSWLGISFGKYDRWGSFTINTRRQLRSLGFSVAIVDTPSDKWKKMNGFRESEEHGQNIAAIIKHMKKDADVPVWLYGHSRGTVAAAGQTINLGKDVIQGAVLSGSIAAGRQYDTYVEDMPLDRVKVPVLVMSADNDRCVDWTPKESAVVIGKRLVNSPNVKVHYHEGADYHVNPDKECRTGSAHSYNGIEEKVTDFVAAFIKVNINK